MIQHSLALLSLLLLSHLAVHADFYGITQGGLYNSEEQLNTHVNLLTLNKNLKLTVYVLSGLSAVLLGFILYLIVRIKKSQKISQKTSLVPEQTSELLIAHEEIKNLHLALQKERTLLVKHEVQMRDLQIYIQELKDMQASKEVRHKTIEMQQKFSGQKTDDLVKKVENTAKSLHPELVTELERRFPDINTMEFQYCMMLILGYNADDIAATLQRSDKAIKSLRYRIRKKMNIQEQEGLKEFLQQLTDLPSIAVKKVSNEAD